MEKVEAGTPAAKAGIRGGNLEAQIGGGKMAVGGDIIVGIDGKAITSAEELGAIGSKKPGDTISDRSGARHGHGSYEKQDDQSDAHGRPNSVKNPNTPEG